MAVPINFKPVVDPQAELNRRLAEAPREHAEALLKLYDTLQAAHDKGLLDLAHGAISARDTIFTKLSDLANTPEGERGMRNLLQAARLMASIDPDLLEHLSNTLAPALNEAGAAHAGEGTPPSLWQIIKRTTSEDGRRGLSFATRMLTALGRATKR